MQPSSMVFVAAAGTTSLDLLQFNECFKGKVLLIVLHFLLDSLKDREDLQIIQLASGTLRQVDIWAGSVSVLFRSFFNPAVAKIRNIAVTPGIHL